MVNPGKIRIKFYFLYSLFVLFVILSINPPALVGSVRGSVRWYSKMCLCVIPGPSGPCSGPTSRQDSVWCRLVSESGNKQPFSNIFPSVLRPRHMVQNDDVTLHHSRFVWYEPCWGFSHWSRRVWRRCFHTVHWEASLHTRVRQATWSCCSEAGRPAYQTGPT